MTRLLTPLLVFAACYAWLRYAKGSPRQRVEIVQVLGWGVGLAAVMFFAVRSGQLMLAAVIALVMVGLRALPGLAGRAPAAASGAVGAGASSSEAPLGRMSRSEAFQVLDLAEGASPDEINARYRVLIKAVHPDVGGSSYLATQLNRARQVLLGDNARTRAGSA